MKLVVVGGQSRNLGKTALVCDIVRALADCRWTAVKITQHGRGYCPVSGEGCGSGPEEHRFAISEEHDRDGRGDTSRYLGAGAARAFWLRVKQGQLGEAWPVLRRLISDVPYVIIESNSILGFLQPDLYLVVLDYGTEDFKESARTYLDRADAFVLREAGGAEPAWEEVPRAPLLRKPVFTLPPGCFSTPALLDMVRTQVFSK